MTPTCGQDDLVLFKLLACNSILKSFWNNLGSELQLSKLKWCNIDEAKEANNDFFITAKIVKICRQIVAESDGWNWKDDPMAFRQGILLKDMSSTPPEGKLFP